MTTAELNEIKWLVIWHIFHRKTQLIFYVKKIQNNAALQLWDTFLPSWILMAPRYLKFACSYLTLEHFLDFSKIRFLNLKLILPPSFTGMKQYSKLHEKYGKSKLFSFCELQYGIFCAITYYGVIRNKREFYLILGLEIGSLILYCVMPWPTMDHYK